MSQMDGVLRDHLPVDEGQEFIDRVQFPFHFGPQQGGPSFNPFTAPTFGRRKVPAVSMDRARYHSMDGPDFCFEAVRRQVVSRYPSFRAQVDGMGESKTNGRSKRLGPGPLYPFVYCFICMRVVFPRLRQDLVLARLTLAQTPARLGSLLS